MKLLFVVHRYAPFPGGSEVYVQNMAEEMLKRGHDVTVLAQENKGPLNGIKVTNAHNVLSHKWDLIIVHGGDCISQNVTHANAAIIKSPVLYLIIKPSESSICLHGGHYHPYLGFSTSMDQDWIKQHGWLDKARRVRHGIPIPSSNMKWTENPGWTYFVSAGGWWPHKKMDELAEAFKQADIPNTSLRLFGYGAPQSGMPPKHEPPKIKIWEDYDIATVHSSIALAGYSGGAYILNSSEEGFGLVLLEAMMLKTPWIARNIAGAKDLTEYGVTYETKEQLINILKHDTIYRNQRKIQNAYEYAMANHTIQATCNDIEDVLWETKEKRV